MMYFTKILICSNVKTNELRGKNNKADKHPVQAEKWNSPGLCFKECICEERALSIELGQGQFWNEVLMWKKCYHPALEALHKPS